MDKKALEKIALGKIAQDKTNLPNLRGLKPSLVAMKKKYIKLEKLKKNVTNLRNLCGLEPYTAT